MTLLRAVIFALILTAAALPILRANSAPPSGAAGLWLTENHRSVIRIEPCGDAPDQLCGKVAWITQGGMQTDYKNPDAARHTRPMCGLPILWGFHREDESHWTDGTIYKADDGDTYHATLQLLPNGRLLVHGYIGMPLFGVSQTWERVGAAQYPACHP